MSCEQAKSSLHARDCLSGSSGCSNMEGSQILKLDLESGCPALLQQGDEEPIWGCYHALVMSYFSKMCNIHAGLSAV